MRVLVVEDEPYMAEAIRDGLRLEAIEHRRFRQRHADPDAHRRGPA
jgi:DNA-binding response OmpR family regulator